MEIGVFQIAHKILYEQDGDMIVVFLVFSMLFLMKCSSEMPICLSKDESSVISYLIIYYYHTTMAINEQFSYYFRYS